MPKRPRPRIIRERFEPDPAACAEVILWLAHRHITRLGAESAAAAEAPGADQAGTESGAQQPKKEPPHA